MREIKFRGKHVNTFKYNKHLDGTWVYGYLIDKNYINSPELEGEFFIDENTVGQFTGLHDKNGKEIYEGDIVEYKDFSNGMYLFKEQPKARGVIKIDNLLNGIYLKGMGTFEGNKAEIIGNIHDNPDLLKEVSHEA